MREREEEAQKAGERETERKRERERQREQPLRESLALSPERLGGPTSKVVMPVSILETMDTEDTP